MATVCGEGRTVEVWTVEFAEWERREDLAERERRGDLRTGVWLLSVER